MKHFSILLLVFVLVLTISSQEEPGEEAQAAAQQAWMEFMTPGEMQEHLAKGVGEWKVTNTFWYGPDTEPMTTEGTASSEMILGGRYLRTDHSGNYMGMPFEGISIEAYDKALEKFVTIWIDNFGTGVMYAEGVYDPASKTVTYEGTMTDPMAKEAVWFKQTATQVDENTNVLEMFAKDPEGNVFKNMEIKMTRVQE